MSFIRRSPTLWAAGVDRHSDPGGVGAADGRVAAAEFRICAAIAAAGVFLTPVVTAANLLVTEQGGCRFGDCWKSRLPMTGWLFAPAVGVAPQVRPFRPRTRLSADPRPPRSRVAKEA